MTALEYMIKKNELVKRVTGKILIPREQLEEVPYSSEFEPSIEIRSYNCPYCNLFYNNRCCKCPMYKDNYCLTDDSTYDIVSKLWEELSTKDDRNELFKLGLKYKRSNDVTS